MNDTPPPTSGRNEGLAGFFNWLRGLGIVKSDDRWIAGVASGIAEKANIDPIIVRGVFVVLTVLGGSGILLYLVAWLLLPDRSNQILFEQVIRGGASPGATTAVWLLGLLVALPLLALTLRAVFDGPWPLGYVSLLPDWLQITVGVVWWGIIVPAGIIWLIVWLTSGRHRGSPPASPTPPAPEPAFAHAPAPTGSNERHRTETTRPTMPATEATSQGATPNGAQTWEQKLDAKTREWDEWGEKYAATYRLGAGFVAISLALALLAGGITAGATFSISGDPARTLVLGLIATVGVLAGTMIVAGIRGRDSGWLGFLAFCGVIALIFTPISTVLPDHTGVIPFGNSTILATENGGDRATLVLAGNVTVDLRELGRASGTREIDVWLGAGNSTIRLSDTHPTRLELNLLAGNVRDQREASDDRRQGGIFISRNMVADSGESTGTSPTIVRVHQAAGNIFIQDESGAGTGQDNEEALELDREIERLREELEELENAR